MTLIDVPKGQVIVAVFGSFVKAVRIGLVAVEAAGPGGPGGPAGPWAPCGPGGPAGPDFYIKCHQPDPLRDEMRRLYCTPRSRWTINDSGEPKLPIKVVVLLDRIGPLDLRVVIVVVAAEEPLSAGLNGQRFVKIIIIVVTRRLGRQDGTSHNHLVIFKILTKVAISKLIAD